MEPLILSVFDYCDDVYGPCITLGNAYRIQNVQKSCIRFVFNIRRRKHVTPYYEQQHGIPKMASMRELHYSCFVHRIIFNNKPDYLRKKLTYRNEHHNRNVRYPMLLHAPRHRSCTFMG